MELRSRVLAEVEPGDINLGIPGPSTPATDGSGEIVPVSVTSRSSIANVARASLSHPDTARLKGATLRAPIASAPQMSTSVAVTSPPDVKIEFCQDVGLLLDFEMDLSTQPTQPSHPLRV